MLYIAEYIVILSDDIPYSTSLMRYLNEYSYFQNPIRVLSKIEYCLNFVKEERVEFILAEEKFYEQINEQLRQSEITVIELYQGNEDEKRQGVYKYQSAKKIGDAINAYGHYKEGMESEDRHKKVVILNPSGNLNTSLLGLLYAITQSKNAKVLCIDFLPYSCLSEVLFQDAHRGLSDYIYYSRQERSDVLRDCEIIRSIHNVCFISHVDHYSDLYELQREDINKLCMEAEEQFGCAIQVLIMQQITPAIEPYIYSSDVIYMEPFKENSVMDTNSTVLSMLRKKGLVEKERVKCLPELNIVSSTQTEYRELLFEHNRLADQFVGMLSMGGEAFGE